MKHLLSLIALLACATASAQQIDLRAGSNSYGVSATFKSIYTNGDLTVTPELGVQRWTENGVTGTQVYLTPSLKYRLVGRLYADFGVGVSMFDRTDYGPKTISSHFQFADHVGLTYHLQTAAIGIRYVHASNAGAKEPNPGMDSVQVLVSYNF